MCATMKRATFEELGQKSGCVILAGGNDVVAKILVHERVVERYYTLAGEDDLLGPWPLPLLASARPWRGGVGGDAWEGRTALERVL